MTDNVTLQLTKRTALMAAASRGSVELCRALLSTGSGANDVTDHVTFQQKQAERRKYHETRAGTSAAHEAARSGHVIVLQVVYLSRDQRGNCVDSRLRPRSRAGSV